MNEPAPKIDFGLLNRLTDLVICSRCFQSGRLNPVVQVVSGRHRPRTLCQDCTQQARSLEPSTVHMLNA